ncbi:hypothetical protein HMPREF9442_00594 [Paraprevotella xylaniphila YIT 11841]|uniref:Uncharacterized protein n=1 Tax=Paraprevotella xylaniphila YIT 11841 TaxID=762982 RepID=F3QR00_9BACT|nr:hypothetical protein HMPREF9442_00594 [Paraprevotella xylaniphila YIT 11841]
MRNRSAEIDFPSSFCFFVSLPCHFFCLKDLDCIPFLVPLRNR